MEITQYYVVAFSENESGSIVLYLLEFRKKIYRTARRQGSCSNLALKEQTLTTSFLDLPTNGGILH